MLLGIDIGTTHSKVAAYDRAGTLLAHRQAPTPLMRGADGLAYYAPEGIWETVSALVGAVVREVGRGVEGLAVASMGEAGVPLDAAGAPTFPIIPWHDARAAPQLAALSRQLSPARFYAITGLYPNPIHTIAKWRWLQDQEPLAWERTALWLSVADYLGFRLTGRAAAERSLAARTMAYDVTEGTWSQELLKLAEVDARLLPPLIDAGTLLGPLTREAAAATGLAMGTPVFVGGHDHICAALACGALAPDIALDSLGTAEGLLVGLPGPLSPQAAGGLGVGPHVAPGYGYLLGGVYSSGGALAWIRELLGLADFEALRALAAEVAPGASPLFIAHFHGAAPPVNDPEARGAFLEVLPEHRREHMARAVYEGVALEVRAGLEAFEQVTGSAIHTVRLVGGGALDPLWLKIRAAVLGRPLEVARYVDMVTLGAALLAGLGAGLYDTPQQAVAATYAARQQLEPEPAWAERYAACYPRYRAAAEALRRWRQAQPHPDIPPLPKE